MAALGLLLERSKEIARIGNALEIATVEYIMSRLTSFDGGDQDVRKLLSHFKFEVKAIIRTIHEDAAWDQDSMVRILEACYVQAFYGDLRAEDYFTASYEARLESPYDPAFESEAYYDHENRLQIDVDHAEAQSMCSQRRSAARSANEKMTECAWVGFW
ncbi:hypothetical protein LTR95_011645, partial [Oleoguttula sp. CCFEE 5521]